MREGYRRGTNHEKQRAPSSTTIHVKLATRVKSVIRTCRGFMRKHGDRGKAIVRFEWRKYKRILQVHHKRRWFSKLIETKDFYKRVYREDSAVMDSWSSILTRVPLDWPVEVSTPPNMAKLQNEWYSAVLLPHRNFAVDVAVTEAPEDGASAVQTFRRQFF